MAWADGMTADDNSFWFNTFQAHSGAILGFLTSRVGRRDLAEDLLQETFVRAMRNESTVPDEGKIRTYLFTTAYHLVVDQSRRKRPYLFSEVTDPDVEPTEAVGRHEAATQEVDADLQRLEQRLHEVLRTLPEAHRIAFQSAVLDQKSYNEVALEQSWTLQQVKTNVYRARKVVMRKMRHLVSPRPEARR